MPALPDGGFLAGRSGWADAWPHAESVAGADATAAVFAPVFTKFSARQPIPTGRAFALSAGIRA